MTFCSKARVRAGLVALAFGVWVCGAWAVEGLPDWHATVRDFARSTFTIRRGGTRIRCADYELAKALALEDGVSLDDDVLFAAAYLHDMAAFAPWDREKEGIDHADEAARIVGSVLQDTNFPMAKIEAVSGAIRTHMFDRQPSGPEALYLHDADALDWLGAIGVARVMALVDPSGGDQQIPRW